jgi:transcriptional regulator with XRE-family HTH domain
MGAQLRRRDVQGGFMAKGTGRGRGRRRSGGPNPIDVHVGSRVRMRRMLLGLSQEKLGDAIGLTFQQVQKYERGANRIGASRLYELGEVLGVPVAFFYDEMPARERPQPAPNGPPAEARDPERDPMTKRETLELVRAYNRIDDATVRRRIFELVKTIARSFDS